MFQGIPRFAWNDMSLVDVQDELINKPYSLRKYLFLSGLQPLCK